MVKVKLVKAMFSGLKNEFDHFDFDRKNKNVILKTKIICPLVNDDTPANDRNAVELTMMSDVVIEYEKEHFPIEKPSVAELIELSLEEKEMTQKQLAMLIGISPSRINDYVSGLAEPTLKIARQLCRTLNITPAAMLEC